MKQEIIQLFDQYTHEKMDRDVFLKKLAKLAGGTLAATTLLGMLETNYTHAATVHEQDPDLETGTISVRVRRGKMSFYFAKPRRGATKAGIMVIHENRGLNPHIEDVTRRAAKAGFYAFAPDALSLQGGTPKDSNVARNMIRELDRETNLLNFVDCMREVKQYPACNGKMGAVGFCWGGGMVNQLAVNSEDMNAGVAFYGRQAAAEDVGKIKASLLLHYAELDQRINQGIGAYKFALTEAKKDFRIEMHQGVNHAFHNDTSEARYDEATAKRAWKQTIDFFNEKLT